MSASTRQHVFEHRPDRPRAAPASAPTTRAGLRSILLATCVAFGAGCAATMGEGRGASPIVDADDADDVWPIYLGQQVLYFDAGGRPCTFEGGRQHFISPSHPRYAWFVRYYRKHRSGYARWHRRCYRHRGALGGRHCGFRPRHHQVGRRPEPRHPPAVAHPVAGPGAHPAHRDARPRPRLPRVAQPAQVAGGRQQADARRRDELRRKDDGARRRADARRAAALHRSEEARRAANVRRQRDAASARRAAVLRQRREAEHRRAAARRHEAAARRHEAAARARREAAERTRREAAARSRVAAERRAAAERSRREAAERSRRAAAERSRREAAERRRAEERREEARRRRSEAKRR